MNENATMITDVIEELSNRYLLFKIDEAYYGLSLTSVREIIQVPTENYIFSKTYNFTPRFVSIFQRAGGETGRYAATYCSDYATDKYMIYVGSNTGMGEITNPGSNVTSGRILGISGNTVYVYMNKNASGPAYLIVSS